MSEAWALAALAVLAWLWFDSMRAREHAVAAGSLACERNGLQFLDPTGECVSLRPARDENGRVSLRRVYPVEFSHNGDNRRRRRLVMMGGRVQSLTTGTVPLHGV